jgi:hypothetical protein
MLQLYHKIITYHIAKTILPTARNRNPFDDKFHGDVFIQWFGATDVEFVRRISNINKIFLQGIQGVVGIVFQDVTCIFSIRI